MSDVELKVELARRLEISVGLVDEIIESICAKFADFNAKEALAYLVEISDIHQPDPGQEADIERLKTRWRRWLGNKTAQGKAYWTTLLDSTWSGWCRRVCENHEMYYELEWSREAVKRLYGRCIDVATFEELLALDGIYADELVRREDD